MVASSPFAARSRVLARLASLAQIGELVRRLIQEPMSHIEVIGFDSPQNNSKYLHFSKHVTSFAFTLSFHKGLSVSQSVSQSVSHSDQISSFHCTPDKIAGR